MICKAAEIILTLSATFKGSADQQSVDAKTDFAFLGHDNLFSQIYMTQPEGQTQVIACNQSMISLIRCLFRLVKCKCIRWLHRGPPLWLWPGSRQAPPVPGPSCLLPGSSLLRHPLGLCLLAPSRGTSVVPTRVRTHLLGGGDMSGFWTVLCVFLFPMCSVTQFLSPVHYVIWFRCVESLVPNCLCI